MSKRLIIYLSCIVLPVVGYILPIWLLWKDVCFNGTILLFLISPLVAATNPWNISGKKPTWMLAINFKQNRSMYMMVTANPPLSWTAIPSVLWRWRDISGRTTPHLWDIQTKLTRSYM